MDTPICDDCKKLVPETARYHNYDLDLCPSCWEYMDKMDEAECIAEQRAERYNEEVLAGMHAPEDEGDYRDRIAMLYDPMFN